MSNFSNIPISHYKVLSMPLKPEVNSVYYVLDQNNNIVQGFITDKKGVAIPLFNNNSPVGNVQSVTGTGVTGTATNPKINIATFISNQLGNQVYLSAFDGKLQVNPITSPDSSIEITATSTELQIQLSSAIASIIDSALQSGDNISELVNDVGYVTLLDLSTVAETGDYDDLINKPSTKTRFNTELTDGDFLFVGDVTQYTDEQAQDAVGNILIDTATIDFTYNDAGNTITADVKPNSITAAQLSDTINISEFINDAGYELTSNKGIPNGYPSLDGGGKIPVSQLPNSVMEYKGVYDASTNTPILVDGVGNTGDVYRTTVAGAGVNGLNFVVGDYATYNGTTWEKAHSGADNVTSVFGRLGTIVAQNGDYTASQITNVPSGNISSITVQAALNELDTEKAIDANVVHKTGFETISGQKEFSTTTFFTGTYSAQFNGFVSFLTANSLSANTYSTGSIGTLGSKLAISGGSNGGRAVLSTNLIGVTARTFDFPNQSGTFALTSDLTPYALDANVLHKTGNESWTGVKSSINTGTSQSNGILLTNNGTSGLAYSLRVDNNASGQGIRSANASIGFGIRSENTGTGTGIYASNDVSGNGIKVDNATNGIGLWSSNVGTGQGIRVDNGSTGIGIFLTNTLSGNGVQLTNAGTGAGINISNTLSGSGIISNGTTPSTGLVYIGQNNGVNTFTVDKLGNITSTTFIKSGATASNILLAGGSDIPQSTFVPSTRTISINGVTQDLSTNRSYRAGLSNTGALTYAGSSVASATTVNIGAVTGVITDNETTPSTPSYQIVTYAGATNITVPTIGSGTGTYVLLNNAGALVFQNTFPTSAQRKSMIYLSKISHPNLSSISFIIDEPDFVNSPLQQFRDLFQVIQYMNQGITISGNAGLTINSTNGVILGDGINFVLDKTNPNMLSVAAGAPRNFLLLNQSGAVGSFVTTIDPANYDVGGVTTPIGGSVNSTTIQYLYYAPGVGFAILRGQTVYGTLLEAVSAVGRESFVLRPNLVNNSILIAAICLRRTTTAMNDPAYVRILLADKFGQIGGASSGISVTNLQTAYNNSLIPQITTTSALGAFTLRNGGTLDTDNVFAIQNIVGTTTASINGNGAFTGTSWNGYTPANDVNVLHTTGTEIFSGSKMAVNAGSTGTTNGFVLSNNGTGDSTSLKISNNSTGIGSFYTNGNGIASKYESSTGTTGDLIQFTKNLVLTSRIDHNGRYIVSGSPATNILLAGGTDIPQSTFALASGSGSYIQNQNASAQSANMWISGTGQFEGNITIGKTGIGGGGANNLIFNYETNTSSRSWRLRNDDVAFGDFSLQQSTTQTGSLYDTKLYINPSGNVGIGTTNPLSRTQINKASQTIGTTIPSGALIISDDVNTVRSLELGVDTGNSISYIQGRSLNSTATFNLALNPSGGNVGIGTANPVDKLQVLGNIRFAVNQNANDNGYYGTLESTNAMATGVLSFVGAGGAGKVIGGENYGTDTVIFSNATEKIRILNNGNVGIGTTTPLAKNHIVGGGSATDITTAIANASLRVDVANPVRSLLVGYTNNSGLDGLFIQAANNATNSVYALPINPFGGNVLIGTTTDNGVDKLQVNGSINSNAIGETFKSINSTDSPHSVRFTNIGGDCYFGVDNSAGSFFTSGAYYTNIYSSVRTVKITTPTLQISNLAGTGTRTVVADASGNLSAPVSDESLKENIQPIHYGLNEIMKMNPVSYNFKDKEKYGEGLYLGNIAQDMEKVIPEAVFTDSKTGKMGIEYSHLHAVYIKAIQELQEQINELKSLLFK